MRKIVLSAYLIMALNTFAQGDNYSTYWHQRATLFETLPINKKDIVFVGNSITDGGEWFEFFNNPNVKNRGISGDRTVGVLDRLNVIVSGQPQKIFLLIGINDLSHGISIDSIAKNIGMIVDQIQAKSSKTKIYLQSVLPVSDEKKMFSGHTSKAESIIPLNKLIQKIAANKSVTYIDLYSRFVNPETGKMNLKYTNDGLHLLGAGYQNWAEIIKPYVSGK
ncbi:MAG: GDSL-type esterase/lipase family protein [Bacteroidales bacterium]